MIIGVNGRARSGKDTLAQIMVKDFGFKQISFADPLKLLCSKTFEIPLNHFYDDNLKDSLFQVPVQVTEHHLECLVANLRDTGCVFTPDQINELNSKGLGFTLISPRDLLQRVGTDFCRAAFGNDIWINICKNTLKKLEGNFIISDARFLNERQLIKDLGGYNFLVLRPGLPALAADAHASELLGESRENIDVVILNDSTVNSLQMEIVMWWQAKMKANRWK
jgi:hypothetical protein